MNQEKQEKETKDLSRETIKTKEPRETSERN